jgi:endonuclease/exonuclease/phosphatase family metal-dependent hydrolase
VALPDSLSDRSRRRPRALTAAIAASALAASAAVLTSSIHPEPARATPLTPTAQPVVATFVVLQMNLCNSGMARSCYSSGKAVDEAVEEIRRYRPDMVTLQEVCYDNVYTRGGWGLLAQAMADLYGGAHVAVDFTPAGNRDTGGAYRCVDGEPYGIAVLHHLTGRDVHSGWYVAQDRSPEMRAWTCTTVITGRLTGCTTHLSIVREVAVRQCHELMSILASSPWVLPEVIVAGDVNLTAQPGRPYDVDGCTPAGYDRRGDGSLQHAFYTSTVGWVQDLIEPMRWTDHPMLYEQFRV